MLRVDFKLRLLLPKSHGSQQRCQREWREEKSLKQKKAGGPSCLVTAEIKKVVSHRKCQAVLRYQVMLINPAEGKTYGVMRRERSCPRGLKWSVKDNKHCFWRIHVSNYQLRLTFPRMFHHHWTKTHPPRQIRLLMKGQVRSIIHKAKFEIMDLYNYDCRRSQGDALSKGFRGFIIVAESCY